MVVEEADPNLWQTDYCTNNHTAVCVKRNCLEN
jgi:hypothetical protein